MVLAGNAQGASSYNGSYSGSWSGGVAGQYGSGRGSGSLSFTVAGGTVSGSTGSGSFTGSVSASGFGSGSGTAVINGFDISCSWSGQFVLASNGGVSVPDGRLTSCHDTDGFGLAGSGSFSASRSSATAPTTPPKTTTSPTTTTGTTGTTGTSPGGGCLATATCVVPLLRAPDLVRGQAEVKHADGTTECLCHVTALRSGDTIGTNKIGSAAVNFDFNDGFDVFPNTTVRVAAPNLFEMLAGVTAWDQLTSFPAVYDGLAEVWAGPSPKPPVLPEPSSLPQPTGGPTSHSARAVLQMFTVWTTGSFTRVRDYDGAVRLRNIKGDHERTVFLRQGFESTIRGTAPPSKPRPFPIVLPYGPHG